ncbi:GNAT family N-acetyltransferase [Maridesulfovibrio sp.]|uniref:GNAT family N-acetyltransferase n=1 Tax=Maridesulfovibrio sp. TaxID=2795000 RepID=UPI0029CA41CA|nr:GNAT family N-acetyltransferase [Maridesulfovibrio sp.]
MPFENEHGAEPVETELQLKLSIGLNPEDTEEILELAACCQTIPQEKLEMLEQSVWEEAYNTSLPFSTFIRAHVVNGDEQPLCGFAYFGTIADMEDCYELYLVAVDEEFRNIGIGAALVDEIERQISAADGSTIFCEVPDSRAHENSENFLQATGFSRQNRHYRFFIPEKGNAVYAKKLLQN